LDAGVGVALDIGIVEAQHHRPVIMAGKEPIEDECAGAANVEEAGGRWGETDAGSIPCGGSGIRHRLSFFPLTMLAFGA
jgi:hypothetical protein